jgi:lysophospholipase L1-like esterase
MVDNKINRPVLLIGVTLLFVIVLAHFFNGVTIFGYTIKPVDLFSDVKPDSLLSFKSNQLKEKEIFQNQDNSYKTVNNSSAAKSVSSSPLTSSVNYDLISHLLNSNNPAESNSEFAQQSQGVPNTSVKIAGNLDQMKYFYEALKNSKNSRVRIAHYGDSGIEGDAITADIRKSVQSEFGGRGVGYISITSQDIAFRITTKQSFSDNWKTVSVLTANPQNLPLGISGFLAIPQGQSWVRYETTNWDQQLKNFSNARLFYSNAKNSSIKYSFNNGSEQSANLKTGNDIKDLNLSAPGGSASSIKISSSLADQAYFYGVSLESGNGVYVDNFPWRGNTGLGFLNLQESSFKQFDKMMNYKLFILMFGGNEASFGSQDNTWYANQMVKIINNLKATFPQSSFLLITVGDKSVKKGTRFVTDPNIPLLIKVQQGIAERTGIAYWNLFEAMGGTNSMETWVKSNPPLALMDYTHASWQGASRIGQMIAKALIESYKNYKK